MVRSATRQELEDRIELAAHDGWSKPVHRVETRGLPQTHPRDREQGVIAIAMTADGVREMVHPCSQSLLERVPRPGRLLADGVIILVRQQGVRLRVRADRDARGL